MSKPNLAIICEAVAAAYDLSHAELLISGLPYVVLPRKIAAHLCCVMCSDSTDMIARFMQTSSENVNRWNVDIRTRAKDDEELANEVSAIRVTLEKLIKKGRCGTSAGFNIDNIMQRALTPGMRGPLSVNASEVQALATYARELELTVSLITEAFREPQSHAEQLARAQLREQLIALNFERKDSTHVSN